MFIGMKIIVENKIISAIFFALSITLAIVTTEAVVRIATGGSVELNDKLDTDRAYKIEAKSYYKKTSDLNSDVFFAPYIVEN